MAAKPPPRARPDDGTDVAYASLMALVREVRAGAQDFERSLNRIAKACTVAKETGDDGPLAAAIRAERTAINRNKQTVKKSFDRLNDEIFPVAQQHWSDYADAVRNLDNLWDRVIDAWPPETAGHEDVEKRIALVRPQVREILFTAARITAGDRLNQHLEAVRIGKAISFDAVIADEIPDADDRKKILAYLAEHPASVHGVIDTGRGLVFRTSRRQRVRVATYLAPLLAVAAGAGLVMIAGSLDNWLDLPDWPAGMQEVRPLLVAYLFVTAGAVVHVAVEALKQERFGATHFLALDDMLDWLHIRYLSISASVLWVLVGVFGLAVVSPDMRWGTAFLVGYSLDSLGGLFLQRFGQAMDRRRETFTKALEV